MSKLRPAENPLVPDLQIDFASRLRAARTSVLRDALAVAAGAAELPCLNRQLDEYADERVLSELAKSGMRGELLFATPLLLELKPSLLGYYRLLLGFSQKEFYKGWLSPFKSMEERDRITDRNKSRVPRLCASINSAAALLHAGVPEFSQELAHELQLLTLGPQFRGGKNNRIGQGASGEVLSVIRSIAGKSVVSATARSLILRNKAGRSVIVEFANDPDIAVVEQLPSSTRLILSIEIKGGADASNVHNRIGEAEKSHQKAKARGFVECWTIVRAAVDQTQAAAESPSTTRFFTLSGIVTPRSKERSSFRDEFSARVGI